MTTEEAILVISSASEWNGCERFTATELHEAKMEAYKALEKQCPKKPIGKHTDYKCSVCGRRVRSGKGSSSHTRDNYCQRCGQKLDWENA